MIRSNPTAIPLRASDVKSLQLELDKRRATREGTILSTAGAQKGKVGQVDAEMRGPDEEVAQRRKEREEKTVAERIGL